MCLRKRTKGKPIEIVNIVKNINWYFKISVPRKYIGMGFYFYPIVVFFLLFLSFFSLQGSLASHLPPFWFWKMPTYLLEPPLSGFPQAFTEEAIETPSSLSPHAGRRSWHTVRAQPVRCSHSPEFWASEAKIKSRLNVLTAAWPQFWGGQIFLLLDSLVHIHFQTWSPNLHYAFHMSLLCFRVRVDLCYFHSMISWNFITMIPWMWD